MRVRYTGSAPVCFQVPGMGLVEPGAVFEVLDGRAAGFLRRPDIEQVPESPLVKRKVKAAAAAAAVVVADNASAFESAPGA